MLSGGGGGNADGSGGAGGSNFSAGGNGANDGCSSGAGLGGLGLGIHMLLGDRAFLGGGGGGGQGRSSQTDGGNGGGIIFLRAAGLKTSCGSPKISANGLAAASSGNYGAGGGGAAGTIILQINSYNVLSPCALDIEANGGHGGDAGTLISRGGGGGGGGQGAIMVSGTPPLTNILPVTLPGRGGATWWLSGDTGDDGAGNTDNDGVKGGIGVSIARKVVVF